MDSPDWDTARPGPTRRSCDQQAPPASSSSIWAPERLTSAGSGDTSGSPPTRIFFRAGIGVIAPIPRGVADGGRMWLARQARHRHGSHTAPRASAQLVFWPAAGWKQQGMPASVATMKQAVWKQRADQHARASSGRGISQIRLQQDHQAWWSRPAGFRAASPRPVLAGWGLHGQPQTGVLSRFCWGRASRIHMATKYDSCLGIEQETPGHVHAHAGAEPGVWTLPRDLDSG